MHVEDKIKMEVFPPYTTHPQQIFPKNKLIADFINNDERNIDIKVVEAFGEEWTKFSDFSEEEIKKIGDEYFDIFPPTLLQTNSKILDVGCGTGRWTKYLSDKVGMIDAVDPSKAIFSADELLKNCKNVRLSRATSGTLPFKDETYDMVMSIGVLHHIPDTLKAMKDCVQKVKPGGYFYTYLYYSLDNRGFFYKALFSFTDILRKIISRLPSGLKKFTCDIIAVVFYMPFILLAKFLAKIGLKKTAEKIPLSYYKNKSFFIIRNDALDRFGTRLEQRFSRAQITTMLQSCGLHQIQFSPNAPYWHVIAKK